LKKKKRGKLKKQKESNFGKKIKKGKVGKKWKGAKKSEKRGMHCRLLLYSQCIGCGGTVISPHPLVLC